MTGNSDVPPEPAAEELTAEVERLRAENDTLKSRPVKREREPFHWRNFLAWVLTILAFIMAIAAPLASWSHDYMLDTDRFIETIAPLVREDAVAQALSERAAEALIEGLEVEELLKGVLPEGLGFIAAPVGNSIQSLAQKSAKTILQSDQFYWVWERMLRLAHSSAVDAIRGDRAVEVTRQGDIVLDLGELLQNLRRRLVDSGLGFLERVPIPKRAGTVVLFTAEELGLARGGIHALDTLNWVLPLLALLFFAAAVAVSTDRRKFLMVSGIAVALAMAVSLISLRFTRNQLLGRVELEANLLAAQVLWSTLFRGLVQAQWGILFLGVVVAAGAAVAGPYQWANWLRINTLRLFASWQDRRRKGEREPGPIGGFLEAHKGAFRLGGIVLVFLILLLLPKVTTGAVIGSAIALAIYLALIELVRAPGSGDASGNDIPADSDEASESEGGPG
jgi:hypothetical protein